MPALCVRDCMAEEIAACHPHSSLEQAAHLMWIGDCGMLPVVGEQDQVVGVVTDRDLAMAAYLSGKPLREALVQDCMSRTVHTCQPSDRLGKTIRALGEHRVRRLPVVDSEGSLLGVLSLNDLVRALETLGRSAEHERLGLLLQSALASICEPRSVQPDEPAAPAAAAPARKTALVES